MSSDEQKQEQGTATRTQTEETSEEVLTPQEEKVVRARRGLAEDDDHELSFGLGANEEAREKMARLESFLLGAFRERESGRVYFSDVEAETTAEDEAAKNKIVDALSDEN